MDIQTPSPCCSAFVSLDESGSPYCKKCYEPAPLDLVTIAEYEPISDVYELRNYKQLNSGNDFPMWTAELFENGHKVAYLTDRGDGGEIRFDTVPQKFGTTPKAELRDRLQAAAEELPPITHSGMELGWTIDMLFGTLAAEAAAFKHAKTYFTFIPTGAEIGGFAHLKVGRKKVRKDDLLLDDWLAQNTDITIVRPR